MVASGQHRARQHNRKLLVSVFNPQEAREAVLGGARIVDSEDPRSALGNIKPRQIMAVSDAVLHQRRDQEVQLSTNIGEDQLLFRRAEDGHAIQKSPYEIAGKAAQAALGVAESMGTRVHPCNIVKVGLDGMEIPVLRDVLAEVVDTLNRSEHHSHSQVMSVLFAQDLGLWEQRRNNPLVVRELVALREFTPVAAGADHAEGIDLLDHWTFLVRADGTPFPRKPDLDGLRAENVLPGYADTTRVRVNDPFPHADFGLTTARRTDREAIRKMVDVTAEAGADGIMIDTSVLFKVARVGLVDTAEPDPRPASGQPGPVDLNRFDITGSGADTLVRTGILSVEEIRFFVDYCHHRGVEANLAGSMQSYQAQQVWRLVEKTDQLSTRGGASAVPVDPANPRHGAESAASRRDQVMKRELVAGLAPPEQGGYVWLPERMRDVEGVTDAVHRLRRSFPDISAVYWADRFGNLEPHQERP